MVNSTLNLMGSTLSMLNFWRAFFSISLLLVGGCGLSEVSADAEPIPWWALALIGLSIMALCAWIVFDRDVNDPGVEASSPPGCSKELIVLVVALQGVVLLIVGVVGAFYPQVLIWVGAYSEANDIVDTANDLIWFFIVSIAVTVVCIGLLVRGIVRLAQGKTGHQGLWASLFWLALFLSYYAWIYFTNRWDELFFQPLADFFSLLYGE